MKDTQATAIALDGTTLALSSRAKTFLVAICILASFAVPFLIGHPQLFVGILVNALLVLGALHMKKNLLLPLIMLPSLGVLARGAVFGPFTMFLVYMMPVIWLANALLVRGIRYFSATRSWNVLVALCISVAMKCALLFGIAWALVSLGVLPNIFLTTMGGMQVVTALVGGLLALSASYGMKKLYR